MIFPFRNPSPFPWPSSNSQGDMRKSWSDIHDLLAIKVCNSGSLAAWEGVEENLGGGDKVECSYHNKLASNKEFIRPPTVDTPFATPLLCNCHNRYSYYHHSRWPGGPEYQPKLGSWGGWLSWTQMMVPNASGLGEGATMVREDIILVSSSTPPPPLLPGASRRHRAPIIWQGIPESPGKTILLLVVEIKLNFHIANLCLGEIRRQNRITLDNFEQLKTDKLPAALGRLGSFCKVSCKYGKTFHCYHTIFNFCFSSPSSAPFSPYARHNEDNQQQKQRHQLLRLGRFNKWWLLHDGLIFFANFGSQETPSRLNNRSNFAIAKIPQCSLACVSVALCHLIEPTSWGGICHKS